MRRFDVRHEGFGGLKVDPYNTLGDGGGGCVGDGGSVSIQPDGGTRV